MQNVAGWDALDCHDNENHDVAFAISSSTHADSGLIVAVMFKYLIQFHCP